MKRTTYFYYVQHEDQEFPVPVDPIDSTVIVHVKGDRAVVGYLSQDPDPVDPRGDDNLGTMVCWHRNLQLGDKHDYKTPHDMLVCLVQEHADIELWDDEDVEGLPDEKLVEMLKDKVVIQQLYLMDHSGVTIRTDPGMFRAVDAVGWDWGRVGVIYVPVAKFFTEITPDGCLQMLLPDEANSEFRRRTSKTQKTLDRLKEAFKEKKVTHEVATAAFAYLDAEVTTYDQYLNNDVYGVCTVDYRMGEGQWCMADSGECWDYYGYEYATDILKEEMDGLISGYFGIGANVKKD